MRTRDELKIGAIFEATVKLVNGIGFVASSVSKIAKEANVSPATIYIYYKNKEDLLVSTYLDIKQKIGLAIIRDFDDSLPIRDTIQSFWNNAFAYALSYPEYFQFGEQFSNSPYSSLVQPEEAEKYFEPMFQTIEKGIDQKIIKDVPFEILKVFIFSPVMILSNSRLHFDLELNEKNIETAFNMAWDAIRL